MSRKTTGELTEHRGRRGVSWGCRFRRRGKRYHVTLAREWEGGTEESARAEMAFLVERVNRGLWSEDELRRRRAPSPTSRETEVPDAPEFRLFASRWLADKELARGGEELGDLRWRLESHLLPYFAGRRLDEIGVQDVDEFARWKLAEGRLGAGSVNKMISTLAAILETATEYGHVPRNVAAGKRRKLPAPKPRRTYLDRAEPMAALLDAAGAIDAESRGLPYRRALLATLAFAGLRIGEAMEVRWRDVDLAGGRLRVRGTKTEAADRVVDLLPALRDELATLAAADRDREPNSRLFRTSKGGPIGSTNVRKRVLSPAIEAADRALRDGGEDPFPEGITPHSLRRTFASILVALGKDPAYVMAQMGHTTSGFTLNVYAQMMKAEDGDRERLRALVEGRLTDWTDPADGAAGTGKNRRKGQKLAEDDRNGDRPFHEKTPPERGFRRSG
jgi:integrase